LKTRTIAVLALAPVLFAVCFLIAELLVSDQGTLALPLMRVENETGKVLCMAGAVAAALAFDRGDYLRAAWLFLAACQALLLARDLTLIPAFSAGGTATGLVVVRGVLVIAANAAAVVGTGMLARAWSVAGLDEAGARGKRTALFAATLAAALLVEGWPLIEHAHRLLAGDLGAIVDLASDVGDTISFALVVPVLQTALAMRGGALLLPWALLTIGGLCWISYDVAFGATFARHVIDVTGLRVAAEALRFLGTTFTAAAGLAQRRVVTREGEG
jgi:hypothetical protein